MNINLTTAAIMQRLKGVSVKHKILRWFNTQRWGSVCVCMCVCVCVCAHWRSGYDTGCFAASTLQIKTGLGMKAGQGA